MNTAVESPGKYPALYQLHDPGEWNVVKEWASDAIRKAWYDPNVDVDTIMSPIGLTRPTATGNVRLDDIAPRIAQILAKLQVDEGATDQTKAVVRSDTENLCKAIVYSYHTHIAESHAQSLSRAYQRDLQDTHPLITKMSTTPVTVASGTACVLMFVLSGWFFYMGIAADMRSSIAIPGFIISLLAGVCLIVSAVSGIIRDQSAEVIKEAYNDEREQCLRLLRRYKNRTLRALRGLSRAVRGRFPHTLKADIQETFGEDIDADPAEGPSVTAVVDYQLAADGKIIDAIQFDWNELVC